MIFRFLTVIFTRCFGISGESRKFFCELVAVLLFLHLCLRRIDKRSTSLLDFPEI